MPKCRASSRKHQPKGPVLPLDEPHPGRALDRWDGSAVAASEAHGSGEAAAFTSPSKSPTGGNPWA